MNEMRRTLLWVVFSMSLVLLWDGWNKHNGRQSMFGPTKVAQMTPQGASAPGGSASTSLPQPATAVPNAPPRNPLVNSKSPS